MLCSTVSELLSSSTTSTVGVAWSTPAETVQFTVISYGVASPSVVADIVQEPVAPCASPSSGVNANTRLPPASDIEGVSNDKRPPQSSPTLNRIVE